MDPYGRYHIRRLVLYVHRVINYEVEYAAPFDTAQGARLVKWRHPPESSTHPPCEAPACDVDYPTRCKQPAKGAIPAHALRVTPRLRHRRKQAPRPSDPAQLEAHIRPADPRSVRGRRGICQRAREARTAASGCGSSLGLIADGFVGSGVDVVGLAWVGGWGCRPGSRGTEAASGRRSKPTGGGVLGVLEGAGVLRGGAKGGAKGGAGRLPRGC